MLMPDSEGEATTTRFEPVRAARIGLSHVSATSVVGVAQLPSLNLVVIRSPSCQKKTSTSPPGTGTVECP